MPNPNAAWWERSFIDAFFFFLVNSIGYFCISAFELSPQSLKMTLRKEGLVTSDQFLYPNKAKLHIDRRKQRKTKPTTMTKEQNKPTTETVPGKNYRKIRINSLRLTISIATEILCTAPQGLSVATERSKPIQEESCQELCCSCPTARLHQTGGKAANVGTHSSRGRS